MALTDIIKKIGSDAQAEADRIVADANEAVKGIEKKSKQEVKEFETQAATDRERRASKAGERIVSAARHQAKFIKETFKNDIIEKTFAQAEKNLSSMSNDDYALFVTNSLETLGSEASKATYVVAKEKEAETEMLLKKAGVASGNISAAPEGALGGGFIAHTDREEFDFSFNALLKRARGENEIRVSKELFT